MSDFQHLNKSNFQLHFPYYMHVYLTHACLFWILQAVDKERRGKFDFAVELVDSILLLGKFWKEFKLYILL